MEDLPLLSENRVQPLARFRLGNERSLDSLILRNSYRLVSSSRYRSYARFTRCNYTLIYGPIWLCLMLSVPTEIQCPLCPVAFDGPGLAMRANNSSTAGVSGLARYGRSSSAQKSDMIVDQRQTYPVHLACENDQAGLKERLFDSVLLSVLLH